VKSGWAPFLNPTPTQDLHRNISLKGYIGWDQPSAPSILYVDYYYRFPFRRYKWLAMHAAQDGKWLQIYREAVKMDSLSVF
jgi:hypothetical protein